MLLSYIYCNKLTRHMVMPYSDVRVPLWRPFSALWPQYLHEWTQNQLLLHIHQTCMFRMQAVDSYDSNPEKNAVLVKALMPFHQSAESSGDCIAGTYYVNGFDGRKACFNVIGLKPIRFWLVIWKNSIITRRGYTYARNFDIDFQMKQRQREPQWNIIGAKPSRKRNITCSSSALLSSMTSERQFSCQTILQKSWVVSSKGYWVAM